MKNYQNIRREYGNLALNEADCDPNPLNQFTRWFNEILTIEKTDPNAMVLSTVDASLRPDSRVLLLKEVTEQGFVFYTNYESHKAHQLQENPFASMVFYWATCARQVRIRGVVQKIAREKVTNYFKTRPYLSQVSAIVSEQSQVIPDRAYLEKKVLDYQLQHPEGTELVCPKVWGGYELIPYEIEFFQGRDSRLHDRIRYRYDNEHWVIERLSA
jgi:pyridoxamine 5'-phosphate oxidase